MLTKINSEIPLFEKAYGDEFPVNQYYVILFADIPSIYSSRIFYDKSIIDYLINLGFNVEKKYELESSHIGFRKISNKILINSDKHIIITANIDTNKNDGLVSLIFYYSLDNGELSKQFDLNELKKFEKKKKKSNINLVVSDRGHLSTEPYDITIPTIDIKLNYGEDFLKIHKKIVTRLNNDDDKGIILLHGEPGTGKTSYLKYLTGEINNKEILFIPPSMAEMLSEPSFIPFLIEYRNSLLIIEDSEKVIGVRGVNGSSIGVSNLLNLTDGILGDCLKIQVIATFNMTREKIDEALLRKGRLIAEHFFDKLSVENTNKLLKHLKKNHTSSVGLTLADIYNIDEDDMRTTKEPQKIGFRK